VVRATFASLPDALTLLLGVPLLMLVARGWVAGLASDRRYFLAMGLGFLLAFTTAKFARGRLDYHRSDGVLAAFSFAPAETFGYAASVVAIGLTIGLAIMASLDLQISALVMAVAASGAAAGWTWPTMSRALGARWHGIVFWRWRARSPRRWPCAWIAAIGAATGGLCAASPLGEAVALALTIAVGVVASALLGRVDAAEVSYITIVGHSSGKIIIAHVCNLLAFFLPFAAALAFASDPALTIIGALFALVSPAVAIMRILSYRCFGRRLGDWMVAILIAIVAVTTIALPPAAPLVLLVSLVWLFRRAAPQTWLIA
jgi:hypothetical protein